MVRVIFPIEARQGASRHTIMRWAFLMLLLVAGCKEELTDPLFGNFQITAEFVGVGEAFLRMKVAVNDAPWMLLITRDSTTIFVSQYIYGASLDTTIHDIYLRPSSNYVYRAYYLFNLTVADSSAPLNVTTMDASSNAFTWQLYRLGYGFSHGYRDVAIVNDTCVWAVGEVFEWDSVSMDLTMYNAARWDGSTWKEYKVPIRLQSLDTAYITDQDVISSVFATPQNDVWFASGAGGLTRYQDSVWDMIHIPYNEGPGSGSKIWGTSSQDLYFGAFSGRLTHYDGNSWQHLVSGTTLPIQDIWGALDSTTGNWEILAVASSPFQSLDRWIMKISGLTVTRYNDRGINSPLLGVWFVPGKKYFAVGDSIFTKGYPGADTASWALDNPYGYLHNCIRGNGINDAVIAGGLGDIIHYDGLFWHTYIYYTKLRGNYYRVAMRGDMIVAVGDDNGQGVVAFGRR